MNIPKDLKYTKTHEWVKNEGGKVTIGITDHAQHEITDVVHVELPEAGKEVQKEASIAVVESVKAAFDIYSPITGKIVQVNENIASSPELVNNSPYDEGYLIVIEAAKPEELDALMSAEEYEEILKGN